MLVREVFPDGVKAMSLRRAGMAGVVCGAGFGLMLGLGGCTRTTAASETRTLVAAQARATEEARQQLDLIPPPSKTRYLAVKNLTQWENPYMTVQGGMVTLHVTAADANTTDLGLGGMLRPVGARRQVLNVRLEELTDALRSVPQNNWPYGRVVAVEEAHDVPPTARPEVRRNMEAVMKTLNDLGVVVYEWNEGSVGR